jgi:dihydroxyacetone kinase DhaKLM complex PTS-EIIA-like component DhaM
MMLDCPLVEGAVLAAVESTGGITLDELAVKIKESYNVRKFPE